MGKNINFLCSHLEIIFALHVVYSLETDVKNVEISITKYLTLTKLFLVPFSGNSVKTIKD